MKTIIAVMLCSIMVGCMSPAPVMRYKQGAGQSELDQDTAVCKYEATKASPIQGSESVSTDMANTIAAGMRYREIFNLCLESKGWARQ